jgi:hypothetical protein
MGTVTQGENVMSRKVNLDLERSPVGIGLRKVGQWVSYDEFTDGAGASGTKTLAKQIPAGSLVLGSKITVTEGFAGDTTAVVDLGDGSDADLFSQATFNVLAVLAGQVRGADIAASGAGRGIVALNADTTITVTVTGGADFGAITAGRMYVEVFYLSTNPEILDKVATRWDAGSLTS